jgi:hypothetical protein
VFENAIWIFLGVASILACIQFFVDPTYALQSSIGRALAGPLDDAWNVMWAVGGAFLMTGIFTASWRTEAIGHMFFCAGVITNALAICVIISVSGTAFTLFAIAFASLVRIIYLIYVRTRPAESAGSWPTRPR